MKREDAIRLFGQNNLSIEAEIRRVEVAHGVNLGHIREEKKEEGQFYPQFSEKLRQEAEDMARHYVIFYCLENSIRDLVTERLRELHGEDWWEKAVVPQTVRDNCKKNRERELGMGFTPRSEAMIDYSTFGELGEILNANKETFGDMLRDLKAVQRIFTNLNTLRGPIAHCKPLAEDEVLRLHLGLRDWFRQMS
ncbi:Swt1 family HEPN domain-containing protein [Bradyrhizobium yuanmingense]|uniref:Swt1 family HEPN domain-containing protein n=1 Tax=Bradyrhizobium yuanmingense TaxID=108015 RepID=UPI0023B969D4|nr:Swt1 family HEPN domain-containing protein [Bradyrhizobium yuanmingense]MDF0497729.1 Swt1 family HEPN domain-containing protein [Bradyrhizobium yuanmingense]